MLLGQKTTIWTDHNNPTQPNTHFYCDRVIRQRLLIEEHVAKLKHIKGCTSTSTDVISRLPLWDRVN